MNLTQSHLAFYREKKTPTPQWAIDMLAKKKYPWSNKASITSVDGLINSQVEKKPYWHEAHNACVLVRGAKRIMDSKHFRPSSDWPYTSLEAYLYHLAFSPCVPGGARRSAYARRWYNRLYRRAS